jgi:hypothetical protein
MLKKRNDTIQSICLFRGGVLFYYSFFLFCLLKMIPSVGIAGIQFEEVTSEAGIHHVGATYGASWGDLDGDGWPDLWVGNHNRKPSLYLNRRNGTFEDIIDSVWSGDPKADTHGASWADFDNDGDQDLVEVVSASENPDGTFCAGCGKNHLYINEKNKLWERAADFGLDHVGQASSPLWFDANLDGFLDLLVVNTRGQNQPSSVVFLQNKNRRFSAGNKAVGFKDALWDRRERIWGRIENMMKLTNRRVPSFASHRFLEFAQLADLSSNGASDLVLFSNPTRVFAIDSTPFKDKTNQVGLPDLSRVKDVAIADFNGDGEMDIFAVEGPWLSPHVIQTGPSEIKGMITWSGGQAPKSVSFKADGDIHIQIYPTWLSLSKVYIGSTGRHPAARDFLLSPEDPGVRGSVDAISSGFDGVTISYEPEARTWTIRNVQKSIFVDFIAKATRSISEIKTDGFDLFTVAGKGVLFFKRENGFVQEALVGEAGKDSAPISVVAGDFDNDMDVDLYLVCTGPIMNLPNILLENDGKGNFRVVPDAGGAAGSKLGRGDVAVAGDYDRDGFLDLFVTNGADPNSPFVADGPHQLFHNPGNGNHWLEVDLEGTVSNRDGIGSRVMLEAVGITQTRVQNGGMHRIAQNYQRLHFGLGKNTMVSRLTVTWPSGTVQHLDTITADQILHITEPAGGAK